MAVLLLMSIAISFISCWIYVEKTRELRDIKRIYDAMQRDSGPMDNIIRVLSEEISDMG
jgi:hypothetical protein